MDGFQKMKWRKTESGRNASLLHSTWENRKFTTFFAAFYLGKQKFKISCQVHQDGIIQHLQQQDGAVCNQNFKKPEYTTSENKNASHIDFAGI